MEEDVADAGMSVVWEDERAVFLAIKDRSQALTSPVRDLSLTNRSGTSTQTFTYVRLTLHLSTTLLSKHGEVKQSTLRDVNDMA